MSAEKTRIFCSPNVNHLIKNQISECAGYQLTGNLGKYLGAPLHHSRVTNFTYQFVIDKARKRMSTWKAKTLSLAGRATLIRSVLNSLPIYYMQTALLPIKVCDDLDKIARDFLWGSCGNRRRPSLVARDKVCTPSQFGGLGFKSTRRMNEALIMKLGWELMTRRDKLWVNVLRHKYNCGNNTIPNVAKRNMESNIWRGIRRTWHHVTANIKWVIGDGRTANFWSEVWLGKEPLLNFTNRDLSQADLEAKVFDYATGGGDWDWSKLAGILPTRGCMKLASHLPPAASRGMDVVAWNHSKNNEFSVSAAYSYLANDRNLISNKLWRKVWDWHGP